AVPGLAHPRNAWTWAGSVVEPVLDNPKPFIELVLDVPGGGRSEFAWEGRAPARPRCRGVAPPRYAWTCAGCVVERVLDNPKPFIELVLDVPGGGRSEFAWEGRAPARPRCRGVAPLRYAGASPDSKPASEWSASESGCCRPAVRVRRRGRPGPGCSSRIPGRRGSWSEPAGRRPLP